MAVVLTTTRFENLLKGESFDERYTMQDVDPVTSVKTATDLTNSVITAELYDSQDITGTLIWSKSTDVSGITKSSPATDGYFLLEIRGDTDYTAGSQSEGTFYYLQIWFDRAGDDVNRIPVVGGRWRWTERGVATP